ncbi:WD40 repeat-like protein [Piedraia hortae CBS 480.64]|uniref:WD40 repeat-like protein n=1 Tax=Piedraia hortae CBS 480.64 TaxID=1314780 RepID=A0A6A7C0X0_9PEZI|nr:WD40 repeat-like protein [Piedraia hortae CBS 480.64]
MAYQQQQHDAGGGEPQGTPYTLQGVMRFLQLEWHSHERARNAWDIERAEMKAKIAKQEGECRHAKRVNDQLERQIRMLEQALKNERANNGKGEVNGEKSGGGKPELDDDRRLYSKSLMHHEAQEKERDNVLDNTSRYLKDCMREIQYLLTPPHHPPLPKPLPNGDFSMMPRPPEQQQQQSGSMHSQALPQQDLSDTTGSMLPTGTRSSISDYSLDTFSQTGSEKSTPDPLFGSAAYVDSLEEEEVDSLIHTFTSLTPEESERGPRSKLGLVKAPGTEDWMFDEEPTLPAEENRLKDGIRRPDTDTFPLALQSLQTRSPRESHKPKSSQGSRRHGSMGKVDLAEVTSVDSHEFRVKFALRGHLDTVRSIIFSGGGSPSEPEVCTAGDDGTVKRWIIPATYQNYGHQDLDIGASFTHRGHNGIVTSLAPCPVSMGFSTGGRAHGDGWIFSGGQDATVRVWERGRVDPKATLEGHTDAVWAVCVLPAPAGVIFGTRQAASYGGPDRLVLLSGSADGTVKVWAVTAPPHNPTSSGAGSRRGVGGSRRHSVTSGSNFPTSPQPSTASNTPFGHTLIHNIRRSAAPTSISALSAAGETFVVAYADSSAIVYDTRTGEEVIGMASNETYDGTPATQINSVVAISTSGLEDSTEEDEGIIMTGHEDRFVRFFDANSGQCTYTMLAHPNSISSLALPHSGKPREVASGGHDASVRVWSMEKRICVQEMHSHRAMRGEGVTCVCWSGDGRLLVAGGGDGVCKVFCRV